MSDPEPLEKLAFPPIVEVICGVFFEGLTGLDPVRVGTYWQERRDEYPTHSIHSAAGMTSGLVLGAGTPPLRTWLVSPDDGPFVLQLQADRFYLNWRRRGAAYPRFSTEDGLLVKTLREFARFADFCADSLGQRPEPRAVELGKIDHLIAGKHFADRRDLGVLLPTLDATLTFARTETPEVLLRFREVREDHSLTVTLASAQIDGEDGIRLEASVVQPLADDLRAALESANRQANQVFAALIPEEQRKRFQTEEGAT